MTEQPLTNRAQLEADLDDERSTLKLQQQLDEAAPIRDSHANAVSMDLFRHIWDHPGAETLPDDLRADFDAPGRMSLELEDRDGRATIDLDLDDEQRSWSFTLDQGAGPRAATAQEAAATLDLTADQMTAIAERFRFLVDRTVTVHKDWRRFNENVADLRTRLEESTNAPQTQQPGPAAGAEREWATDALDEPFTPERVAADWIQSTTMVKAYLEADRPDLARDWINELDENLRAFRDGEAAPGSDEAVSVYHDAVARDAIPYGTSPLSPEEVRQQLAGLGEHVAPLDVQDIRESTGISPLDANYVASKLDESAPLPSGLEDIAAARLDVRRAIASISEDSEAAQEYLRTANARLGQVVEQLRPDQAHEGVLAVQESVQQASEKVAAVADTAAKVEAEVTVYSLPDCVGCAATKRALDKAGVEYEEIPLQEHPDLVARFKQQGLAQAPIVETSDGDRWAGFNPGKLKEHGLDHRTRQQRTGGHDRDTGQGR